VLSKLDQFHGNSRFTTWAYKFALLETAVKLRRRPRHQRKFRSNPQTGRGCATCAIPRGATPSRASSWGRSRGRFRRS
jgi:hypothetical protein